MTVIVCLARGCTTYTLHTGGVDGPDMMTTTTPVEKCSYHPCGWIHYRNGDWNDYHAHHVTTNTFCSCSSNQMCRYSTTRTALDLHIFTCQDRDSSNTIFPGTIIKRR